MKIIVPGRPNTIDPSWLIGGWPCRHCGCLFEIEASDVAGMMIVVDPRPNGRQWATVACPCCKEPVIVERQRPAPSPWPTRRAPSDADGGWG